MNVYGYWMLFSVIGAIVGPIGLIIASRCSSNYSDAIGVPSALMTFFSVVCCVLAPVVALKERPGEFRKEMVVVNDSDTATRVHYLQWYIFSQSEIKQDIMMPGEIKLYDNISVIRKTALTFKED